MKVATKKIAKDIEALAKTTEVSEIEIMEEINSYFKKESYKNHR